MVKPRKKPAKLILIDGTVIPETTTNNLETGVSAVTVYKLQKEIIPIKKYFKRSNKEVIFKLPALTIPWHRIKEIDWGYDLDIPPLKPMIEKAAGS